MTLAMNFRGERMNFESLSEQEIMTIATPIMDNLMAASTRIDHEAHIKDFTDRMKQIVTEPYFEQVCHQYQAKKGVFLHREALAVLKRPDSAAILWKQFFTKVPGEFVAEMVLVEQDGQFLCDHAMVF
jgi:hypothetical protein